MAGARPGRKWRPEIKVYDVRRSYRSFQHADQNLEKAVVFILEFISVGFHAYDRFIKNSLENKETITIFGNGSLGFVTANVLKYKFPNSKIVVIGRNLEKLKIFSFVDEIYSSDDIPEDFSTDHGFECAGYSDRKSVV